MSLEDLRKDLSVVDQQLVELIAERERLVSEIGRDKRSSGKGTRDYAREKDVLDMGRAQAQSGARSRDCRGSGRWTWRTHYRWRR
jgi:chorismate mutase